jgi:hypothetical protein
MPESNRLDSVEQMRVREAQAALRDRERGNRMFNMAGMLLFIVTGVACLGCLFTLH